MIKNDLREIGYAEKIKHQKSAVVTGVWVISTLVMILSIFFFTVLIRVWKIRGGDFFDFLDDMSFMFHQIFQRWRFTVYWLLWALIFLTLYFITRRDLREQKLSAPLRATKWPGKCILRLSVVLLVFVAFFYLLVLIAGITEPEFSVYGMPDSGSGSTDYLELIFSLPSVFGPIGIFVYLVLLELLYLAVKLIVTVFVCQNKKSGIHLEILKGTSMPVCSSQEAFSIWHVAIAYLVPLVFVNSVLLGLCGGADAPDVLVNYTVVAIFMSFFMSYDLALVLYVAYMKIRYKMDYISIDRHIYEVTLFQKSYVNIHQISQKRP